MTRIAAGAGVLLILAGMAQASSGKSRTVECAGRKFRYVLYSPAAEKELPAVLLLHGAGDRPEPMVEAWMVLAQAEQIALIAPELPREEKFEPMAPQVFRCMIEDAKRFAKLDTRRLYLFGNSMGGYLAYDAALLDSEYYAAAAIHAMRIADDYTWIVEKATRKIPIAIYVGDSDQFFPVAKIVETRNLLLKKNSPVHFMVLKNHDHNYYALSEMINADAWNFMRSIRLDMGK